MNNDKGMQITSCEGAWTVKDTTLYGSEMVEDFASACKWEESSFAYVEGVKAVHKLALRNLPTVTAVASAMIDSLAFERFNFWQSLKVA